jgi:5-methylcytosine-specific restriction enzyme A
VFEILYGLVREHVVKRLTRSSGWWDVRETRITLDRGMCRACGKSKQLQVHHIKPFHIEPELELDIDNTITLCLRCHLFLGHLDWFKSSNPDVVADSKTMLTKIENRKL